MKRAVKALGAATRMRDNFDSAAIRWVFIIVAYAYVARLAIVWFVPISVYWTVPASAWPAFSDSATFLSTSLALALAFASFYLTIGFTRRFNNAGLPKPRIFQRTSLAPSASVISFVFIITIAIAAILNAVAFARGIGHQGRFIEEELPFKLVGAIIYAKTAIIPALLLLLVYWAEVRGKRGLSRFVAVSMVCLGLIDMFVLESRGAALKPVLMLALLVWISGFRLKTSDKYALTILFVSLLLAVQVVTSTRLLGEQTDEQWFNKILFGLNFLLFRITGIEQLMAIQYLGSPIPLSELPAVLASPRGIPGYYTIVLLGVDDSLPQTFAPSGLGWLYLAAGLPGIIVGSAIAGLLVTVGWRSLSRVFPSSESVVKTFYLLMLIIVICEGAMEPAILSFLVSAGTLKLMEPKRKRANPKFIPANHSPRSGV